MTTPNIDHLDALDALDTAYQLICEFQIVIDNALEGDHQMSIAVDRWLTWYEKVSQTPTEVEGHPV